MMSANDDRWTQVSKKRMKNQSWWSWNILCVCVSSILSVWAHQSFASVQLRITWNHNSLNSQWPNFLLLSFQLTSQLTTSRYGWPFFVFRAPHIRSFHIISYHIRSYQMTQMISYSSSYSVHSIYPHQSGYYPILLWAWPLVKPSKCVCQGMENGGRTRRFIAMIALHWLTWLADRFD